MSRNRHNSADFVSTSRPSPEICRMGGGGGGAAADHMQSHVMYRSKMSDGTQRIVSFHKLFIGMITACLAVSSCHQLYFTSLDRKINVAGSNLNTRRKNYRLTDGDVVSFNPDAKCPPFDLLTVTGKFSYPGNVGDHSLLIHLFDPNSGFLESLWSSEGSLHGLLSPNATSNTKYLFIPLLADANDKYGALWMRDRILSLAKKT